MEGTMNRRSFLGAAAAALAPAEPSNADAICGAWALQQVGSIEELERVSKDISAALATPRLRGFLIAGTKAAAVDAVAAAVMGFDPARLPFLALAEKRGFGGRDIDATWTRGNEIEEARRPFRKPARWAQARS